MASKTQSWEQFYDGRDPPISEQTKSILLKNGVPEDQIVSHIRTVV